MQQTGNSKSIFHAFMGIIPVGGCRYFDHSRIDHRISFSEGSLAESGGYLRDEQSEGDLGRGKRQLAVRICSDQFLPNIR